MDRLTEVPGANVTHVAYDIITLDTSLQMHIRDGKVTLSRAMREIELDILELKVLFEELKGLGYRW
jgi:hypothetical protein